MYARYTPEEKTLLEIAYELSYAQTTLARWVVETSLEEARRIIAAQKTGTDSTPRPLSRDTISSLLQKLTFREREIVLLIASDGLSIQDVAKQYKVTYERIRQILEKAKRKITVLSNENPDYSTIIRMIAETTMFKK